MRPSPESIVAYRGHITGRVQGVGFRYTARDVAESLGLAGWVRNEDNGSVLTEFQGSRASCSRFQAWLERGPPGARIDDAHYVSLQPDPTLEGFSIQF